MTATLERLNRINPDIQIKSIDDEEFASYGQKITLPYQEELLVDLQQTVIPERNNVYIRNDPHLLSLSKRDVIARNFYGEQKIEIGYCNGNSYQINAFEFHNCSEINLAASDLVLFLSHRGQLREKRINTNQAKAFFVPKGTAIELYNSTMHFAPCCVWKSGFKCLVILTAGTNTPLNVPHSSDELLFQKNKWLLTHAENKRMVEKNAFVGLIGKNLAIKKLEE
ncbi:DUF4867 family protein [Liquorilactobacillus sicerae]|uniref:DUF4867 family protein n=1 Tax=Liquorilactobacillus sicerae TaxID=1416943 RepID=UPI00248171BC|nr:DUF4867 family protein [Liquorilactobacillus sicerae]